MACLAGKPTLVVACIGGESASGLIYGSWCRILDLSYNPMDLVVDGAEEGTPQRRASQVFTPQHKLEVR